MVLAATVDGTGNSVGIGEGTGGVAGGRVGLYVAVGIAARTITVGAGALGVAEGTVVVVGAVGVKEGVSV